jgi:hypothetical protein
MLNDADFARLSELIQKTDKTQEEAEELAKLRGRAMEAENNKPAELPVTAMPGSLDDALAQLRNMKELFAAQQEQARKDREERAQDRELIALLRAGQDAIASGQVRTLFRHCNVDGRRLREGEDRCPCGGATNHVGLNPANGVMMLVKQT